MCRAVRRSTIATGRRDSAERRHFGWTWTRLPGVAGRGLEALAAAFGVEPNIADLATVVTQRLETEPSAADWSAVLTVVGILITIDSRNIKRLRDKHRIPKSQRSVMAQMVAAHNPDVDPDDFVGRVLALVGAALAASS